MYAPMRGRVHTLSYKQYSYLANMTKIPTPSRISPYSQIIYIQNPFYKPWLLLHLYISFQEEDLPLVPKIQNTIDHHITINQQSQILLCDDFNREIALHGTNHNHTQLPPTIVDLQWKNYITNLHLSLVPNLDTYSRQGRYNYTY
jgi:hypothetical protein